MKLFKNNNYFVKLLLVLLILLIVLLALYEVPVFVLSIFALIGILIFAKYRPQLKPIRIKQAERRSNRSGRSPPRR